MSTNIVNIVGPCGPCSEYDVILCCTDAIPMNAIVVKAYGSLYRTCIRQNV